MYGPSRKAHLIIYSPKKKKIISAPWISLINCLAML